MTIGNLYSDVNVAIHPGQGETCGVMGDDCIGGDGFSAVPRARRTGWPAAGPAVIVWCWATAVPAGVWRNGGANG